MKNKDRTLDQIFLRKMAISALTQIIIVGVFALLLSAYLKFQHSESIKLSLKIDDSFILDEITKYKLLGNDYALSMLLYDLTTERRLDSIEMMDNIDSLLGGSKCSNNAGFWLCETADNTFLGLTTIHHNNSTVGYLALKKKFEASPTEGIAKYLLIAVFVAIAFYLFNILYLFLSMKQQISAATEKLLSYISSKPDNNQQIFSIAEYQRIAEKFQFERSKIIMLQEEIARKTITEQLAHDIRSPLAALHMFSQTVHTLTEEERRLVIRATDRITAIANNLLKESNSQNQDPQPCDRESQKIKPRPENISILISDIISEKIAQFGSKSIEIQRRFGKNAFKLFANIDASEMSRAISNLIGNAIEAISNDGTIIVELDKIDEMAQINIIDDGSGIPTDIIPKLFKRGATFNKEHGTGLGLYSAKELFSRLNGTIDIKSELEKGTILTCRIPCIATPEWFLSDLVLRKDATVTILDDDYSIHEMWNKRLGEIDHGNGLKIEHFYNPNIFLDHLKNTVTVEQNIFLIDFDFIGFETNGIEIIERCGIASRSILVTSKSYDNILQGFCLTKSLPLIPKSLVSELPIRIFDPNTLDIVLIDNDELVRNAWEYSAIGYRKNFLSFETDLQFIRAKIPFDVGIFIDQDLGNGLTGISVARGLKSLGYRNLYLATGYETEFIESDLKADSELIKGIRDKTFPVEI